MFIKIHKFMKKKKKIYNNNNINYILVLKLLYSHLFNIQ